MTSEIIGSWLNSCAFKMQQRDCPLELFNPASKISKSLLTSISSGSYEMDTVKMLEKRGNEALDINSRSLAGF